MLAEIGHDQFIFLARESEQPRGKRIGHHFSGEMTFERSNGGNFRPILLLALAFETRQQRLDGFKENLVGRIFPGIAPGANVEARVPGKILAIHGAVFEIRRVPVEAASLVIRNLMFPNPERELCAGFRYQGKTTIP